MRRVVLEITLDGPRICAASVREQVNPLRGFWRRWSAFDRSQGERITTTCVIEALRGALRDAVKGATHE
jgi:hypothetical protein